MYMYLQVRKSADRSLIYRLQISFYLNVLPFQDYFTHIETGQSVGGAKKDSTPGKPPGASASRTWLVPHVTSAGLKPTPSTAVG